MGVVEDRLKQANIELPAVPSSLANYVGAVRTGNLIYLSGRLPMRDGQVAYKGKLGRDVTADDGYQAARLAALNVIATLRSEVGELDRVTRIVKIFGMATTRSTLAPADISTRSPGPSPAAV